MFSRGNTVQYLSESLEESSVRFLAHPHFLTNKAGGYMRFIFQIENLNDKTLIEDYRRVIKQHGEGSPFQLLEEYGTYPSWLYIQCFGSLKALIQKTIEEVE